MPSLDQPTDLTAADVVRVYSGKPGCACGCRGTYYEPASPSFRRVVSNTLRRIAKHEPGDTVWSHENPSLRQGFVSVENDRHVWTAYYSVAATAPTSSIEAGWND